MLYALSVCMRYLTRKEKFQTTEFKNTVQRRCSGNVLRLPFLTMLSLPQTSYLPWGTLPSPLTMLSPFILIKRIIRGIEVCFYYPLPLPLSVPLSKHPSVLMRVLLEGSGCTLIAPFFLVSPLPTLTKLLLYVFYPLGVLLHVKNKLFCVKIF